MDYVFSTDPDIIVTEVEEEDSELSIFYIYLDGEQMGIAYNTHDAKEVASDIFEAITGGDMEESAN